MAAEPMRTEIPSSPVAAGEILAGKYRVERLLGAGGMGVVVAARHMQLDQLVALKFVLPTAVEDKLATERFLREAKAAVRLKSEHVAKVLDVGTLESGAPYIVMEYLEGTNLAEVIAAQSPLNPELACDFLIQACEALSEAHSHGIVHRDLKPQNLFLTKGVGGAPLVKVLDFGISKIKQPEGAQNLTQTSTVVGSPMYMAPEQMRSAKNVDERTDIWSLGVVLYELLSGKLPFEAESLTDLAIKIVQEPFVPLVVHRPTLAPDLAAVVHRCLEKNPADRFSDAGELASALEAFAPVASRVTAERARKVVSASQATMGAAVSPLGPDGSGQSNALTSPFTKPPNTPQGWSDTTAGKPKSRAITWAIVALGVAVVVALLAHRALDHASPSATIAPVAASPAPAETTAPPPVTATATPPPAVSAAAAPAPSASSPTRPTPSARPSSTPRSAKPPGPGASKSNPGNDDIPSLR